MRSRIGLLISSMAITSLVNIESAHATPIKGARSKPKESAAKTGALKKNYLDLGPYMVEVSKKISKNWKPPKKLLPVKVKWQIARDGSIIGLMIERSSGDPDSDKAAIDAVAKSAPFAPLPEGVDMIPMLYSFRDHVRSGMHQIPVSERRISIGLSNSAAELANNKNFPESLEKLDFAFERDPKNPMIARVLRYISAYINDDTPDNINLLHKILALDPRQHAAIEKLRILLRASGVDPDSASQRFAQGKKCLGNWDAEGALVEFSAANSIKRGTAPTSIMLKVYRILAGNRMARKWETIARVRKDVETFCGLGRSYQLAGNYKKAESFYKKALELDQTSQMAKGLMAKLAKEKETGEKEEIDTVVAEHNIGEAGKGDLIPRARLLYNEGVKELQSGNMTQAFQRFKKALEMDPMFEHARVSLSATFNNMGAKKEINSDKAITFFRKALYVNPNNDIARKNLNNHLKHNSTDPKSYSARMELASKFAGKDDFISAVVEVREALRNKSNDKVATQKLEEYKKKAPAIPPA